MFDFLRRLAPPDLQGAAHMPHAQPVLAPRFADGQGAALTGLHLHDQTPLSDTQPLGAALHDLTPQDAAQALRTQTQVPPAQPQTPVASLTSVAAQQLANPLSAMTLDLKRRLAALGADHEAELSIHHAVNRATGAMGDYRTRAATQVIPPTVPLRAAQSPPSAAPAATALGPHDLISQSLAARATAAQHRSQADTLAGLATRRAALKLAPNLAPVVHVTIDRVDVRAPAAPTRPTSAPRQRVAAPSVSLADYLRASGSPRKGDAS
jgi:hypothetical protein